MGDVKGYKRRGDREKETQQSNARISRLREREEGTYLEAARVRRRHAYRGAAKVTIAHANRGSAKKKIRSRYFESESESVIEI